jgi:hypothetical protein
MMGRSEIDQRWMYSILFWEMVNLITLFFIFHSSDLSKELCFSYISVAAAIGQPFHIPVIVRSLRQDMYQVGMIPNGVF